MTWILLWFHEWLIDYAAAKRKRKNIVSHPFMIRDLFQRHLAPLAPALSQWSASKRNSAMSGGLQGCSCETLRWNLSTRLKNICILCH